MLRRRGAAQARTLIVARFTVSSDSRLLCYGGTSDGEAAVYAARIMRYCYAVPVREIGATMRKRQSAEPFYADASAQSAGAPRRY